MAEKQYTRQAQEALNMARKIAAELKHPYVGTEHLLFGLKRVFTGVAGQVLDKNKVDEEQMEKAMDILVSAPEAAKKERKHLEYSPRLRYILEESQNEAVQLASEKVGTEHLLLTMLKDVSEGGTHNGRKKEAGRRELIRKSIWKIRRMGKLLAEL